MSRVITFSRFFPSYHPRAGQPTYFVEKIWKYLWDKEPTMNNPVYPYWQNYDSAFPLDQCYDEKLNIHNHTGKVHTIRAGNLWKVGDKFSPRVWSGKPYNSKQITIAPDIEVKKIWSFERGNTCKFALNENEIQNYSFIEEIAGNDGLSIEDFTDWFNKRFIGQIICWNENINY